MHADASTPAPLASTDRGAEHRRLQRVLRVGDAAAIFVAFTTVLSAAGYSRFDPQGIMLAPFAAAAIGVWAIRFQGLWNSRITAMRWVELSKLTRAAGLLGVGMLVARPGRQAVHPPRAGAGGLHRVVRAARGVALGVPLLGRPPSAGRSLHPPHDHRRHRPPGGRAGATVRDPPGGGDAGDRRDRIATRGAGAGLGRPLARRLLSTPTTCWPTRRRRASSSARQISARCCSTR